MYIPDWCVKGQKIAIGIFDGGIFQSLVTETIEDFFIHLEPETIEIASREKLIIVVSRNSWIQYAMFEYKPYCMYPIHENASYEEIWKLFQK